MRIVLPGVFGAGAARSSSSARAPSTPQTLCEPTRYDMHLIFRIDEVVQLICRSLWDLGALGSVVSVACTCRALEEPALCTIWGGEDSIRIVTVLKTLPQNTWVIENGGFVRSRPVNRHVIAQPDFNVGFSRRRTDERRMGTVSEVLLESSLSGTHIDSTPSDSAPHDRNPCHRDDDDSHVAASQGRILRASGYDVSSPMCYWSQHILNSPVRRSRR